MRHEPGVQGLFRVGYLFKCRMIRRRMLRRCLIRLMKAARLNRLECPAQEAPNLAQLVSAALRRVDGAARRPYLE
jgi:hypothetical protein